jgi:cob(I)alamin adenosyltransferase
MTLEKGYIQVYTGDGKGKTTAALGMCLRASGHGMKSLIIQFMKGKTDYGEIKALEKNPHVTIRQFGTPDFVMKGQEREIDFEEARAALDLAKKEMQNPDLSILVLDEINVALHFKLIQISDVLQLLDEKPDHLEVVLTGRRVPDEIINRADLVTRFEAVKHYYDTIKQEARVGIEC